MREWMVVRLGRPEDHTKFLPQPGGDDTIELADEAPRVAPARPAPVDYRGVQDLVAELQGGFARTPARTPARGRGYYVKPGDRDDKSGQIVHTTEEAAIQFAKELAAKNPKVLYGVFTCVRVFETTEPQVIEKSFNDSGELVIESTGASNEES